MNYVLLIVLMAIATFIPRVLPSFVMDKLQLSEKAEMFLQLIPYTAMTAMIFPAILSTDSNIWIGIVGGVVAIGAAWFKVPTIVVVILSIAAVYLMYLV